ncbi:MAG: hypothetical protein ACQEXJ_03630 [Myxococcota bacterium]
MKLLSRMSRVAAVTLAVAGLVAAPGCKKDEDPSEKAGEKAAAEGEAEAPAEGESPEAEGKKEGAAAEADATTPTISRTAPEIPDSVITVVGVPSLDHVLGTVGEIGNEVAPGQLPPDLSPIVLEQVKSMFGFTKVDWLKRDAPAYVFNVDPTAHEGKGQAIVLPISGKDAVLGALPDKAAKDVEGHSAKYEHQFQTWFVDFVDGHAVLTDHAGIFGEAKDFVGGALTGWTPERMLSLHANMNTINRVFGKEIEQARQSASRYATQAAQDPSVPDAEKVMERYVDMAFELVESTTRIDLGIYPQDGDVHMTFAFQARPDTKLEKLSGTLKGASAELAGVVPTTTWLGLAADMDVREMESMKSFQQLGLQTYAKLLELSPEEQEKLEGLFDRITEQTTGESATAFYTEERFPMAIAGVTKVTESGAARDAYAELVDLLFAKAWAVGLEEMKKEGTELPGAEDVKTFDDLVKMLQPMAAQVGLTLAVAHVETDGARVDSLSIEADWDKLAQLGGNPAEMKMVQEMVGDKLEIAIAFEDENVAMGFGPTGIETATKLAGGEKLGGEEILAKASEDNAFALTLRAGALLKALTFVPELKSRQDKLEQLPSDRAYKVTASGDGKGIAVTLGVPVDLTAALVNAFQ